MYRFIFAPRLENFLPAPLPACVPSPMKMRPKWVIKHGNLHLDQLSQDLLQVDFLRLDGICDTNKCFCNIFIDYFRNDNKIETHSNLPSPGKPWEEFKVLYGCCKKNISHK